MFSLISKFIPFPKVAARLTLVIIVSLSLLFAFMAHERAVEGVRKEAAQVVRTELQYNDAKTANGINSRVAAGLATKRLQQAGPTATTDKRGYRD